MQSIVKNNHRLSTKSISGEIRFLIACCQSEPDFDEIESLMQHYPSLKALNADTPVVEAKVGRLVHRSSLITAAAQHSILPQVYKSIKQIASRHSGPDSKSSSSFSTQRSTLNAEILTELKAHYMSIAQRNMLMTSELLKIIHLLQENNIEALAFKGPVQSQLAYGDITLRQYVDLDVLVKKEDIYNIDILLKKLGYERMLKMTPVQEEVYIQNAHDLGFYHPKTGVHFEIHWSLLNEDYPIQMDSDSIWEKSQMVKINGREIQTFRTKDLLIYLCIHGSKHLWDRLGWIKDIDMLIRTQEIDWSYVMKKTKDSGFEIMFFLGLSLTSQLLKTPLPENLMKRISDMKILDTLSDFVLKNWQTPQSVFQKTATMLKLFPDTKKKVFYLNNILIKPSLNEYWAVDLPKRLYWVYYFVRPYMLLKKYLTKQERSLRISHLSM